MYQIIIVTNDITGHMTLKFEYESLTDPELLEILGQNWASDIYIKKIEKKNEIKGQLKLKL